MARHAGCLMTLPMLAIRISMMIATISGVWGCSQPHSMGRESVSADRDYERPRTNDALTTAPPELFAIHAPVIARSFDGMLAIENHEAEPSAGRKPVVSNIMRWIDGAEWREMRIDVGGERVGLVELIEKCVTPEGGVYLVVSEDSYTINHFATIISAYRMNPRSPKPELARGFFAPMPIANSDRSQIRWNYLRPRGSSDQVFPRPIEVRARDGVSVYFADRRLFNVSWSGEPIRVAGALKLARLVLNGDGLATFSFVEPER